MKKYQDTKEYIQLVNKIMHSCQGAVDPIFLDLKRGIVLSDVIKTFIDNNTNIPWDSPRPYRYGEMSDEEYEEETLKLFALIQKDKILFIISCWNLKKHLLRDQKDEVKEVFYKLICGKE